MEMVAVYGLHCLCILQAWDVLKIKKPLLICTDWRPDLHDLEQPDVYLNRWKSCLLQFSCPACRLGSTVALLTPLTDSGNIQIQLPHTATVLLLELMVIFYSLICGLQRH